MHCRLRIVPEPLRLFNSVLPLIDRFGGQKLNNLFSQTFRAPPGYPAKIPGYPAKKVWFPWVKDTPNFLPPTPFRGRPQPHPKISGPKSLGLGSFFFPGSTRVRAECTLEKFLAILEGMESELGLRATQEQEKKLSL